MGRFVFKLPDVGEGTAEAEIVAWHVKVGQRVREDEPLVDVMTDKATVEMTSPVDGVVLETAGEAGEMAAVGSVLAVLETEGEEGSRISAPSAQASEAAPPTSVPREAALTPAETPAFGTAPLETKPLSPAPVSRPPDGPRRSGERPLASPAVRRRAEDAGVKLAYVSGSGPAGRIERSDLEAYIEGRGGVGAPAPASALSARDGVEEVKVIGLRRRIAEKMQASKRSIPHFAYVEEIDMTELEELRAYLNGAHADRGKLTALPFFVRALVKALPAFPMINARFDEQAGLVRRHSAVHLGVAVQTPHGLVVPVVRHAEALDLWEAAGEIARLAEAARTGKAKSEELSGSTITLTSLGPLGGVATTPVINHPEVAIVGPNKIVERPVVVKGQVVIRKMMNLSASFDHRVVDGQDAALFVQRLRALLERPAALFVD